MNAQEIAQQLVNELNGELSKKVEEQQLLQGAIQGINLFYTRLKEAQEKAAEDEQNSKDAVSEPENKAKE
jgi:hypothetical protein